jgi:hypothetical protein
MSMVKELPQEATESDFEATLRLLHFLTLASYPRKGTTVLYKMLRGRTSSACGNLGIKLYRVATSRIKCGL